MGKYIIGGWAQDVSQIPPFQFAYTMYGMITNLEGLTSGTPHHPGWSPKLASPPTTSGRVLWTYGGGGCTPENKPANDNDINEIKIATNSKGWDGVDFDDECRMNVDNIIKAMSSLKPKETSYTFLAGNAYNQPDKYALGKTTNENVQKVASSAVCDRFILMCYAAAMWSMDDIKANVGPALDRTLGYVGDSKKVVLALTPAGLNRENLDYFLNQVIGKDIGGLFVWNFPALNQADLDTITKALDIRDGS